MEEKRNMKGLAAVCLLVLALVLITVGTTFAFFQYSRQGDTENKIETGTLTFLYDESKSKDGGVSIENAFPMSDEDGEVLDQANKDVFDFDVRATTKGAAINYEIYVTKENISTLPEQVVKTYLRVVKDGAESDPETKGLPTGNNLNLYSELYDSKVPSLLKDTSISKAKTLYREEIPDGQSNYEKTFRYRMWIDEKANQVVNGSWIYNNMTFSVKVNVYAQNGAIDDPTAPSTNPYQESQDKSGANVPALVEGLIPVVYDGAQQKWVKAGYAGWYNYDKQEWANAVTVTATHRNAYQEAEPGIEIPMEDINTMWVWIPRYEYNYVTIADYAGGEDANHPGAIDINFINGVNDTPSDSVNYKVHPAFNFGDDKLTGFWYGKFETSSKETCTAASDSVNTGCDKDTFTPQIKPGVTSWGGIRLSTMFTVSRKMEVNTNEYGFTGGNIDTHMSKNSEWGSVAYLSQSKYGKYGNILYTDIYKEIYQNKSDKFITGSSNGTPPQSNAREEQYAYNDMINLGEGHGIGGPGASTTGNITGVYDMNGGRPEYVMGALKDDNTDKPAINNSGFTDDSIEHTKIPDAKYYDLYTSTNHSSNDGRLSATACNGGVCYGHALSETIGWYSDRWLFPMPSSSWIVRGGHYSYGVDSGVFRFGSYDGNSVFQYSFRLALAPTGV